MLHHQNPNTVSSQTPQQQPLSAAQANRPFYFYVTKNSDAQHIADRVTEKIEEFQGRKVGVTIELSALNNSIEHCLKVSYLVQSRYQYQLHQVIDTSMHATRRHEYGQTAERICKETRLDEAAVNNHLRFEDADSRTHEGRFNFLMAQKKHTLTNCITISLTTLKPDNHAHPGYHRPKVPMKTMHFSRNKGTGGPQKSFSSRPYPAAGDIKGKPYHPKQPQVQKSSSTNPREVQHHPHNDMQTEKDQMSQRQQQVFVNHFGKPALDPFSQLAQDDPSQSTTNPVHDARRQRTSRTRGSGQKRSKSSFTSRKGPNCQKNSAVFTENHSNSGHKGGQNSRLDVDNRFSRSGQTHSRRKSQFGLRTVVGGDAAPNDFAIGSHLLTPGKKGAGVFKDLTNGGPGLPLLNQESLKDSSSSAFPSPDSGFFGPTKTSQASPDIPDVAKENNNSNDCDNTEPMPATRLSFGTTKPLPTYKQQQEKPPQADEDEFEIIRQM